MAIDNQTLNEIVESIKSQGIKDSQLDFTSTFTGDEKVVILQQNKNKQANIKDLVKAFLTQNGDIDSNILPTRAETNMNNALETGVYPWCDLGRPAGSTGHYTCISFKTTSKDNNGFNTTVQFAYGREGNEEGKVFTRTIFKSDSAENYMDWVEITGEGNENAYDGSTTIQVTNNINEYALKDINTIVLSNSYVEYSDIQEPAAWILSYENLTKNLGINIKIRAASKYKEGIVKLSNRDSYPYNFDDKDFATSMNCGIYPSTDNSGDKTIYAWITKEGFLDFLPVLRNINTCADLDYLQSNIDLQDATLEQFTKLYSLMQSNQENLFLIEGTIVPISSVSIKSESSPRKKVYRGIAKDSIYTLSVSIDNDFTPIGFSYSINSILDLISSEGGGGGDVSSYDGSTMIEGKAISSIESITFNNYLNTSLATKNSNIITSWDKFWSGNNLTLTPKTKIADKNYPGIITLTDKILSSAYDGSGNEATLYKCGINSVTDDPTDSKVYAWIDKQTFFNFIPTLWTTNSCCTTESESGIKVIDLKTATLEQFNEVYNLKMDENAENLFLIEGVVVPVSCVKITPDSTTTKEVYRGIAKDSIYTITVTKSTTGTITSFSYKTDNIYELSDTTYGQSSTVERNTSNAIVGARLNTYVPDTNNPDNKVAAYMSLNTFRSMLGAIDVKPVINLYNFIFGTITSVSIPTTIEKLYNVTLIASNGNYYTDVQIVTTGYQNVLIFNRVDKGTSNQAYKRAYLSFSFTLESSSIILNRIEGSGITDIA